MRGQKGITLVALVITIIVMLILAGVTISIIVNGGLFTQAENASTQTQNAAVDDAISATTAELVGIHYSETAFTTSKAAADRFITLLQQNSKDCNASTPASDTDIEAVVTVTSTETNDQKTVTIKVSTGTISITPDNADATGKVHGWTAK